MQLSDESLMARVARGDRNAFEILYDRHAARVLGFSLQIVSERAAAEELLQETFLQVWQHAATFPSQHLSFTSWLFRIVRNLSVTANNQRNAGHQGVMAMMDEDAILDPNLEATQIRNALRSLPYEQRQVIRMAFFQGMTRQEIASSTGETLDTISSLARLGLGKLQEALERDRKID
jgi:RNA polymerase sigma-70 factor (ECF subfamily)